MLPTGEDAFFSNSHKSIWANHGPTYSYFIPLPSSSLGSFYSSLSHYSFFTAHFSSWVQSYSLPSSYSNSQKVNIERENSLNSLDCPFLGVFDPNNLVLHSTSAFTQQLYHRPCHYQEFLFWNLVLWPPLPTPPAQLLYWSPHSHISCSF